MTPYSPIPPNLVLLFDGVCGLCHRVVQFFLLRDEKFTFHFAPLQGETAERIKGRQKNFPQKLDSIVLVENYNTPQEKIYLKSEAVIKSLSALGGFLKLVKLIYFIPKRVRDYCYDYMAENRYNWFTKSSTCLSPTESFSERFLN